MSSLSAQQIWQHFSYAVHQVFSRWTALQLAVEQGFGGRNSRDKAIHLEQTVLAYIHSKHGNVDRDDLALILEDEMDEKFNVLLSEEGADRSHEEITKVLLDFGVALQRGDLAEFNRYVVTWLIDWLIHSSLIRSKAPSIDRSIDWLILFHSFIRCTIDWLIDLLGDSSIRRLIDWLIDWLLIIVDCEFWW